VPFPRLWLKNPRVNWPMSTTEGGLVLKTNKLAISILLVSAAFVTPASANYFANPGLNMKFNVGSAPTPTT